MKWFEGNFGSDEFKYRFNQLNLFNLVKKKNL